MQYDEVTPNTPAFVVARLLDRKAEPDEKWPGGFHGWPNVQLAYRNRLREEATKPLTEATPGQGRGCIIPGGGIYLCSAYILVRLLKKLGWQHPIILFCIDSEECDAKHYNLFYEMGVKIQFAKEFLEWDQLRSVDDKEAGWMLKPFCLKHSPFEETLLLDADSYPVRNPDYLFDTPQYKETGTLFWPDIESHDWTKERWDIFGIEPHDYWSFESGEMLVDTKRHFREASLALWICDHHDYYYRFFWGDKEAFPLAWAACGTPLTQVRKRWIKVGTSVIIQYDFEDRPAFQHRCLSKFTLTEGQARRNMFWNTPQDGVGYRQFHAELAHEWDCHRWLKEYREMINGNQQ